MHCFIYIDLAISCAKFGVVVFKASMLDWREQTLAIGICALFYIYIYICQELCQVWCSGIQGIYAQLKGGHRYMCIVLYI